MFELASKMSLRCTYYYHISDLKNDELMIQTSLFNFIQFAIAHVSSIPLRTLFDGVC